MAETRIATEFGTFSLHPYSNRSPYICPARPVTPPHVHSAFALLDLPRETY